MKYELREISKVKRELDVEVPEGRWHEAVAKATRELSRKVRLPGFRPGKVPAEMLRKMFGSEIESDVLEQLVPELYEQALEESSVTPLDRPVLQDKQLPDGSGRALTFTVAFEVLPAVELGDYKGLELARPTITVDEPAVDGALEELRQGAARFVTVAGRASAVGDHVVVDLDPAHGARAQRNVLVGIRDGDDASELDRALVGRSPGDEFEVTLKHQGKHVHDEHEGNDHADEEPAEHEEHEEHEHRYKVRVREVKERQVAEANDDFAREMGDYESLQALRDKLRADLVKESERETRRRMVRQAMEKILAKNEVVAPDYLVNQELKSKLQDFASRAKANGLAPEQINWEALSQSMRPDAERTVLLELVFDAIAAAEAIAVPTERVDETIAEMAAAARRSPQAVRAQLEKEGQLEVLEASLRRERSIDFVLENARVTAEE